jgi:hypothetical protein
MVGVKRILGTAAIALLGGLLATQAGAAPDPVAELANAICAGRTTGDISTSLADLGPSGVLADDAIAEAFGEASFMADLGRCASGQAIADAYAAFKQGKDGQKLDASFAMGRVSGEPTGGTASAGLYQGSFSSLGSAGDPPSGK